MRVLIMREALPSRAAALALMLALAACGTLPDKAAPPPGVQVVEVVVETFVPIDAALTARCDWPRTAPVSEAVAVANARARCLERYEGQLDGIRAVQSRPVPEKPP